LFDVKLRKIEGRGAQKVVGKTQKNRRNFVGFAPRSDHDTAGSSLPFVEKNTFEGGG
jgi:hypothetical protein